MARPTCITSGLLVCTGKKCRASAGFAEIIELAADTPRAHEVPCQGLCKGPVVGMHVDGDVRWFAKTGKPTMRALVQKMVDRDHVPRKLAKREDRKRRGNVRGAGRTHPLDARRAGEILR
ncbi:MAG: hypothetical protein JWM34_4355 [Ilumatobacteraceae bacterium]|nr:hypothetical protein [Ilumatobacteraceae bacterium]